MNSAFQLRHSVLVAATASFCFIGGCTEGSDAIEGRVVDADTRQPVAGANVVAHWRLQYYVIVDRYGGQAQVLEAVTDSDGRFRLPAWKKRHSPFRLGSKDDLNWPELFIFKLGYEPKSAVNHLEDIVGPRLSMENRVMGRSYEYVRPTEWGGHDFLLHKYEGDSYHYENILSSLQSEIRRLMNDSDGDYTCSWDRVAKALSSLAAAGERLNRGILSLESERRNIEKCHQSEFFGWKEAGHEAKKLQQN